MAAAVTTKPGATYEDLCAVPATRVAEIVNGTLYSFPRPAIPHARASSVLGAKIGDPFDWGGEGPGGWLFLDEPEVHLGGDILVPDLAGWRRERFARMPAGKSIDMAPDWVCEVLSPSTAALDRGEKLAVYARENVPHVWFVDPLLRTLEVLRLDGQTYRMIKLWRDDETVRAEPCETIELRLAGLWLPPEP